MKKASIILISIGVVTLVLAGSLWFNSEDPLPQPQPPVVPTDLAIYDPALVEVINQCVQKVRDFPNDAKLRLQLGMVYEANAIYPLAEQTYHQHLKHNPSDAKVWYRLAIVYERIGLLEKSIEAIQSAAEFDNKYTPIHWRLGLWLFDAGQIDAAYSALVRATEIDPHDPPGWYGLAKIALARNEPQRAVEIINAHLLQGITAPRGYQLLGRAHTLLGNPKKAKAAFAKTTTDKLRWDDPWTTKVMANQAGETAKRAMAAGYVMQRNFQKAIPILEDLIKDKPHELALISQLGKAYASIGKPRRGKAVLEHAWKANNRSFQINYALAEVIIQIQNATQLELDQGLMYVNRAIASNSSSSLAFTAKAWIQIRRNRPDSSIIAFKHAYELDTRRTDQLVIAGFLECDFKQYADASKTFQMAINRSPDYADAYVGFSVALTELGRFDEARSALNRAQEFELINRERLTIALNRLKQLQPTGPINDPPR